MGEKNCDRTKDDPSHQINHTMTIKGPVLQCLKAKIPCQMRKLRSLGPCKAQPAFLWSKSSPWGKGPLQNRVNKAVLLFGSLCFLFCWFCWFGWFVCTLLLARLLDLPPKFWSKKIHRTSTNFCWVFGFEIWIDIVIADSSAPIQWQYYSTELKIEKHHRTASDSHTEKT